MGFMDDIKEEQKQYGAGGGNYFKFEKEGVYRIRILNKPKVLATHFFGKGNPAIVCVGIEKGCQYHSSDYDKPGVKLATYVIDRSNGKILMAELPLSISYSINDLQQDQDFAFEGFPMPYDIKITYDPNNTDPKAKYRVVASPKMEPLTSEEQTELDTLMAKQTPEQFVEEKKKKFLKVEGEVGHRGMTGVEYPTEDINPDDIPF